MLILFGRSTGIRHHLFAVFDALEFRAIDVQTSWPLVLSCSMCFLDMKHRMSCAARMFLVANHLRCEVEIVAYLLSRTRKREKQ